MSQVQEDEIMYDAFPVQTKEQVIIQMRFVYDLVAAEILSLRGSLSRLPPKRIVFYDTTNKAVGYFTLYVNSNLYPTLYLETTLAQNNTLLKDIKLAIQATYRYYYNDLKLLPRDIQVAAL